MKNRLSFDQAQYKYKCICYDVFRQSNVEYPDREKSFINEFGEWCLRNHQGDPVAKVQPNGYVKVGL
tara:strand:- start:1877 stop:2077 length:201 start_codon:yes stop_codon:yes gene_type:complete